MPKLLLDEAPLVILPQLAVRIGLNEAIVLQQIHFWLYSAQTGKRTNFFKKGRWWACFSALEWAKQFPFWSEKTVKRTFSSLESKGFIIGEQLSENSWDRTNWYTIDYAQYEQVVSEPDNSDGQDDPAGTSPPLDTPSHESSEGDDALGQFDPMHRDRMTQSSGTDRPDALGQVGPVDGDRMAQSLKKEENTKKQSVEKTTTRPEAWQLSTSLFGVDLPEGDVVVASNSIDYTELTEDLVRAGVGRSVAQRLAVNHPEEARRQLEFLPHVAEFKTSPGAYLRKAIEEGFGPPPGWEAVRKKQGQQEQKQATLERQKTAQAARDQEKAQRRSQVEELKRTVQETDPKSWEELVAQAEKSLPPPIRSRPKSLGYQAAVEHKIEELLLSLYPA